jgi:hypothetical protein
VRERERERERERDKYIEKRRILGGGVFIYKKRSLV